MIFSSVAYKLEAVGLSYSETHTQHCILVVYMSPMFIYMADCIIVAFTIV